MKQKRRTKRLMALALLLASVLGLAWASRITSVSVAGSDTQCVTIGTCQAFLPTATPGNSTEDQIYVDPLYEYRLRLAPDWRISPTPADALFGVATLYNYDPDEVEQSRSFPSDGLRIQIGVGPLKQGQSFNEWIVRRKADQTNSEYGVAVGLMVSESQSVQVGRYSGVAFIFQGRAGPPVLEIDLSHRNQVMSIGLLPANSTSLPDVLAMLATLDLWFAHFQGGFRKSVQSLV